MSTLTNINGVQSPSGDLLTITPLAYNGAPLGSSPMTAGDGIDITNHEVSVDLYTVAVTDRTLNIVGIDPIHDGGYSFLRAGCINNGTFYDQASSRPDAPTYAMFYKPDGPNWDVVYTDDDGRWFSLTVAGNPAQLVDGQPIAPVSPEVQIAVSWPAGDGYDTYQTGTGTLLAPPSADVNVSYSGGSVTSEDSYLEFINGKLRVDINALAADMPTHELAYKAFEQDFDYNSSVVAINGLEEGHTITDVRLLIDTPFSSNVSLSVGTASDNNEIVPSGTFDLTTSGAQVHFDYVSGGLNPYNIYVGSGATSGTGKLLVTAYKQ